MVDRIIRTQSLEDFQRKNLLDAGFTQEDENTFVRVVGNVREKWIRAKDGWQTHVDMIVGVKILDADDCS